MVAIMKKQDPPMHLEIQKQGKNWYGIIRTSFRKDGKVCHTTHGYLKGYTYEQLKVIQVTMRGKPTELGYGDEPEVRDSKEYGASFATLQLAKELGLDKMIYSKPHEAWVQDCLAMIAGRVVYAGSKLSLSNRYKDTALWELCRVEGKVDVEEHCYASMDRLFQRQGAIQKALAEKHCQDGAVVLYDITSSYLEGEYAASELVLFGYNRDNKDGHEQIVIGLLCNEEGCPIGVEVFAGNTKDETTVEQKIIECQERYHLSQLIFVGDRGMITQSNTEKLKGKEGLFTISALTHPQTRKLLERGVIQLNLFDEMNIAEAVDPDAPNRRYCLCRNDDTRKKETHVRQQLLDKTIDTLKHIAASQRKTTPAKIAARVGRLFAKTKMGKFFSWDIVNGKLMWELNAHKVEEEQALDGCYIIVTTVPADKMDRKKTVATYKQLMLVEKAFRNIKTVQLEIRPIYHKTDDRIRCHVFICMLAYYLQWHMQKRLQPLFESDGEKKNRFWTFENVIERLKSIRRQTITHSGVTYAVVSKPDSDQLSILNLLNLAL